MKHIPVSESVHDPSGMECFPTVNNEKIPIFEHPPLTNDQTVLNRMASVVTLPVPRPLARPLWE